MARPSFFESGQTIAKRHALSLPRWSRRSGELVRAPHEPIAYVAADGIRVPPERAEDLVNDVFRAAAIGCET